ncbi:MAG: GNAT family N-acetyltransferase [Cyanobacteria bacterium Co-bin13]|nr:GNAT family N-acetyltransferase [Cyanobacteria bacterium Co-bin13]
MSQTANPRSTPAVTVRPLQPGDEAEMRSLFCQTVHQVNSRDYSPEQIQVWASSANDEARWRALPQNSQVLVAEQTGKVVGFTNLEADGHIDMFFVHHQHQGQGVGKRLMQSLETLAQAQQLNRLYSEVSITARPFFLRHGFDVVTEEQVERQGIWFTRFIMERSGPFVSRMTQEP